MGNEVIHTEYGKGLIVDMDGNIEMIVFDNYGIKKNYC